jgi:hypothetical protein
VSITNLLHVVLKVMSVNLFCYRVILSDLNILLSVADTILDEFLITGNFKLHLDGLTCPHSWQLVTLVDCANFKQHVPLQTLATILLILLMLMHFQTHLSNPILIFILSYHFYYY